MKKSIITATVIVAMAVVSGCSSSTTNALPKSVSVDITALYPEGIAYHDKRFYLGSYYQGSVVSVDLEGKIREFAKDDALVSVVGIHVDKKRNQLIVCNSDSGFGQKSSDATKGRLAEVVYFDIKSGKKLRSVDLSALYQGGHFLNDFAIDDDSNLYVTDSFSPVIYKIDAQGKASVFAQNALFQAPEGSFGLNGIVYHDGFLIVGRADNATLFKLSLNDPNEIKEIVLDQNVHSLDGLLLRKDGTLFLVSNNFTGAPFDEAVYEIKSTDNWESAKVVATHKIEGNVFPTTLTEAESKVYVNYSHLPELIMKKPVVKHFEMKEIDF